MDFVDLKFQQKRIKERLDRNIREVLAHGQYVMGPEISVLEAKLAAYVGVKHAIGCASGTDALLMALMALGIGQGDAVFTTPFTFIATAEVISLVGATPVFVDINNETFNIDPQKLEQAILAVKTGASVIHPLPLSKTVLTPKCVIPVDLFGLPADYDVIASIAKKHGIKVIEDAAQSFGAEYKGIKSCSFGQIGCTSFFPAKPLGCYGDGGMCFTNEDNLASVLRSIMVHGQGGNKYENIRLGINGRLDTLQAAILLAKFEIFPEEMETRQTLAANYTSLITPDPKLKTQYIPPSSKSAWAQYSILAGNESERAVLLDKFKEADIPTAIYYPTPLHLQTAFVGLGYKTGDFPISEDCAKRIFSIPMHPYLLFKDQQLIANICLKGR
jgi:dTDP-4-amino-4,6-dideoxygalactose transaminase